jgi:hypothetical protein
MGRWLQMKIGDGARLCVTRGRCPAAAVPQTLRLTNLSHRRGPVGK